MIEMQYQLEPSTKIGWLHTERRELESDYQVAPSKGPRTVIPTAIFSVVTSLYEWTEVQW